MNYKPLFTFFVGSTLLFTSCVSKGKLIAAEEMIRQKRADSVQLSNRVSQLNRHVTTLEEKIVQLENSRNALQQQLNETRNDASSKLNRSEAQIREQQRKLEQLQTLIEQQRRTREELRLKISDALVNFKSNELTVSVKNGKVYVSLQESLLFPSGSAVVNPKGTDALASLAMVLNGNPDINVLIEGHTDSIPIKSRYADNWELSVERSSAIVRILTNTYQVDPTRVTASGRSFYEPIDSNSTPEGRARNRRTEIILEPKLNELMRLIQSDEPAATSTGSSGGR